MKNAYLLNLKKLLPLLLVMVLLGQFVMAQRATVAVPIGVGSPCNAGGSTKDSVKYFDYNATTNILTYRSVCQPKLAAPGFSDALSTITFNPFDGYLYFTQIANVAGAFNSYTYRWLPNTCPNLAALPVYKTFLNQFIAGVEFDPLTGMGYQISFVDSTGSAPINPDATGNVGQFTSGAVINADPAMAYFDVSNGDLKYVRASDINGTIWNTPVTVSSTGTVGQYTSLTTVNGFPAISYYDATNGDLKYVRATDASGTAWGTPVTVDATGNVGQFTSLVVINGNPAISYYDVTNGDLKYARATDASGTAWGTPVTISSTGTVGQYTSMAIVNGNPAIAYYDATNGDLKYVRSSDINGAAWAAPVTAEAPNNVGQYTSLVVVNGNPAISFYDATNADLRYIRSTDVNGAAWGTGVAVSTPGSVGQYTSMAIVNGNPAISYYDATGQDLKYIRATDVNGAAWGINYTGEATGTVGQYSSLVVVNGTPAMFYYDGSNQDAKFVRSKDINGAMWYSNSGISKIELQQINFATGVVGLAKPVDFGTHYIYQQNGDVVMTPSGQMLASYDNKYLTINWKDYVTGNPLVATYIDTLKLGANNYLVGLAYSDGKLVSSIQNAGSICSSTYKELDILTGAQSAIAYNAGTTIFVSADMTDITSGIGAAKKLISATENPVGSKTYDIIYEVLIKNVGGTPISNVQGYDTLTKVNGAGNMLSASITSITAPTGITSNTLYDGKTILSLLTPGSSLSNLPGQNTITLQITCRIAGIQPGIVYNNQAVVNATGMFGDPMRDSSTNGSNPDLNGNDKPDDPGEGQPTPLLISVTPQTPPCTILTNILYTQTFGTGTGLSTAIPAPVPGSGVSSATGVTMYAGGTTQPIPTESYTITNNVQNANTNDFLSFTDHTGNANGSMLVVNADASNTTFYQGSFQASLCANQQYSLSFYAAFPGNSSYQTKCNAFGGFVYPKIKMRIRDGISGLIITEVSTPVISNTAWQQFGVKFVSPASYTNIIIELINDAPGGCGNDIAIDDVQFGSCDPIPTVNVGAINAGCLGSSTTFVSSLSDPAAIPGSKDYQWQVSSSLAGPYTNITGANASSYTIPSIAAGDTGKFYRAIIAATGNLGVASCQYISPGMKLTGKSSSVAATSATKNKNNVCGGISVNLGITGGTLGTNANWQWYSGSCGGTFVATGATITVTPTITTTYFVRAEGDCNVTACQSVTVTITCNIDKDRDGIPDFVESNMPLALQDANSNGIINAYDPTYAGFVDNNNDYINDNFQADGDSDNDGILNYKDIDFPGRVDTNGDGVDDRFDADKDGIINMLDLDSDNDGIPDVVESFGTDTNGDGVTDSFTDADNDGLTDQVDNNLSGAYNSGRGLGAVDLDGDGVPNFVDLDSDNDGIPDVVEVGGADTNNDGKIDGFTDANGDGLHDSYINGTALLKTGADTNGDGKADSYPNKNLDQDFRPNAYDMDSDGDGIADVIEAGLPDANLNGIVDGTIGTDGWSATVKAKASLGLRNTDGRGNPDYLDIDSDDDGIPDNIEGQTTNGYALPVTTDADGDGLADSYDNVVGFGGSGIFVYDFDGDGLPDYRDLDTDADGSPDIVEGNDFNLNGLADDNVTLTLLDTDGDGLDNRFDSLNSVTNVKGTSYKLGTGGSLAGDATPGTKSPVQKRLPGQADRDWRYVGVVLPVQFIHFTGERLADNVALHCTIITDKDIDHFEIERSINNVQYKLAGTVKQTIKLDIEQAVNFTDQISTVTEEVIYYRMKAVKVNGEISYSNVLVVRRSQNRTMVTVVPNPADEYITLKFFSQKEGDVMIRLLNSIGKTTMLNTQRAIKGNNTIHLSGLTKFPPGVYSLQVVVNDEIITSKIILKR